MVAEIVLCLERNARARLAFAEKGTRDVHGYLPVDCNIFAYKHICRRAGVVGVLPAALLRPAAAWRLRWQRFGW